MTTAGQANSHSPLDAEPRATHQPWMGALVTMTPSPDNFAGDFWLTAARAHLQQPGEALNKSLAARDHPDSGGLRRWISCQYPDIGGETRLAAHPDPGAAHLRRPVQRFPGTSERVWDGVLALVFVAVCAVLGWSGAVWL